MMGPDQRSSDNTPDVPAGTLPAAPAARVQSEQPSPTFDSKLLEILVCPLTKKSLDFDAARGELISREARLAFPIQDGVPLLSVEAARSLDDDDEARRPGLDG
jgi:uncharacterized protein